MNAIKVIIVRIAQLFVIVCLIFAAMSSAVTTFFATTAQYIEWGIFALLGDEDEDGD